jgi:cell wall-associated NlpC family hydrolase
MAATKNSLAYFYYQARNGLYPVPDVAIVGAELHAKKMFPNESVGVVAAGQYWPMTNIHENPTSFFEVDPAEWLPIVKSYGPIEAVIHSHTDRQFGASKMDMEAQQAWGVPFGIITMDRSLILDFIFFGDGTPIAPYVGRPFKDGVYDCYALCRDWYWQETGIRLKDYARAPLWWDNPEEPDLIDLRFKDIGFEEIEFSELQRGDAIVGSLLGGTRTNHCGLYLGDGLLLHHIYGDEVTPRVSGTDVIYSWKRMIRKCLRYKGELQAPAITSNG